MALALSAKAGASFRAALSHHRTRKHRHALRLFQPHANARSLISGGVAIPSTRGVVSRALFPLLSSSARHLGRPIGRS
ncbi:hypothetical protein LMG10661_00698 [Ralstonia syzygii subsp. syzygii]|nr:hypothetical protein LMG10661_00698 [Ralstonia syzygii subsp. syzygii]